MKQYDSDEKGNILHDGSSVKILFLVPYPTEGASNRVRAEQYIPYLESKGFFCKTRPFVNREFYRILYFPHRYLEKALWFIIGTVNRLFDMARALGYDVIFIHREAYPFGGPFFESLLSKMGKPIIFDFDDAIFLSNTSRENIYIERFKNPAKISKIIKMSALVIAGNAYLKNYALKYNASVIVIPSSVDTKKYCPAPPADNKDEVIIGWIGSNTTKGFLYDIEDVFVQLSKRHANLRFKIVGANFYNAALSSIITNKEWRLEDEVRDIQSFDIGIMPMPDNEWTKGKCGFKALLYMACAKPVVASPVGVNLDIIEDGINGFLAESKDAWVKKISILIGESELRKKMGAKGREKVETKYSLDSNALIFCGALEKTCKLLKSGEAA